MKEAIGNILTDGLKADAICVTTCGIVKNLAPGVPGLVMGAGIAKAFCEFFSYRNGWKGFEDEGDLQTSLGASVRYYGNNVHLVRMTREIKPPRQEGEDIFTYNRRIAKVVSINVVSINVVSFPTKEHYADFSPLWLIGRSAIELVALTDKMRWRTVCLPPPGAGLGGRNWLKEVKPLIEPILDDRFIIVHRQN